MRTSKQLIVGLCGFLAVGSTAFAQGTAFTYQGRLASSNNPANGIYDLRFALFDSASAGLQIGPTRTNSAMALTNGLFAVSLDFTNGAFPGADRWLEIGARSNGVGAFTTLSPRQKLTPAPYAVTASNLTGTLPASQLSGNLPASQVSGPLQLSQLPSAVVTNNSTGATLNGTFSGNGAGLTNLNVANVASGTLSDLRLSTNVALRTGGNTLSGNQFVNGSMGIGITNNPILPFQVSKPGPYNHPAAGTVDGTNAFLYIFADSTFHDSLVWDVNRDLRFATETNIGSGYNEVARITRTGSLTLDWPGSNDGALTPGLVFGGGGEGISSRRTAGVNQYGLDFYASFLPRLSIALGGNVGIGTQTPGCSLEVNGGIRVRGGSPGGFGANNNGYAFNGNGGDSDSGMFSSADGELEFETNAGERMRITSIGTIGIGTTNPAALLDVNGTLRASGVISAVGGLVIENRTTDPASPANGQIWLRTDL